MAGVSVALSLAVWSVTEADPPGTITLTKATSSNPDNLVPEAGSTAGLVYRQFQSNSVSTVYGLPSGGSPVKLSSTLATAWELSVANTMVVGPVGYQSSAVKLAWSSLDGTTHGTATLNGTFLGAAPNGWFTTQQVDLQTHLVEVSASGGPTVDFGQPTTPMGQLPFTASGGEVVAGSQGAVVTWGTNAADYFSYATPGAYTTLNVPSFAELTCRAVTSAALGCLGSNSGNDTIVRVPLDGSAPVQTSLGLIDGYIAGVAVTPTTTAWVQQNYPSGTESLSSVPAAGGAVTTSSSPLLTGAAGSTVVGEGSQFVVNGGTTLGVAGLYSLPDASTSPTVLLLAAAAPQFGGGKNGVTAGAGRVVWRDAGGSSLWQRQLTTTGGGLVAGPESLVSAVNVATGYSMDTSGLRTVAVTQNGHISLISKGATQLVHTITDPSTLSMCTTTFAGCGGALISGTRVAYADNTVAPSVYDLSTKKTTTLAGVSLLAPLDSPSGGQPLSGALFGRHLLYEGAGGSVWWADVTKTGPGTKLQAALATTSSSVCYPGRTLAWGDYVAWENDCFNTTTGQPVTHGFDTYLRDVKTMAPAVDLGTSTPLYSLGDNYLALGTGGSLQAYNLTTSAKTSIEGGYPQSATVSGDYLVWFNQQSAVRAYQLPGTPSAPRLLGNPIAPSSMSLSGPPWNFEADTSAALSSCNVVISQGSTTVRTLSCTTANLGAGTASVSWDGKNSAALTVAPGTYTWTLVASNSAGQVESDGGAAITITGSILVKS